MDVRRFCAFGLLLFCPALHANEGALLRDQPLPLLPSSHEGLALETAWLNEFVQEQTQINGHTETLQLDSETLAFTFSETARSGAWQARLQLPVYINGGGRMDSAIEGWHRAFGLPNGGRELQARNQYQLRYNGHDLRDKTLVLGALHAQLAYAFHPDWQALGFVQTPSSGKLARWGTGAGVAWQYRAWGTGQVQTGFSWQQQRAVLPFRSVLGWVQWQQWVPLSDRWQAYGGLQYSSSSFASTLAALNQPVVIGDVGLRYQQGAWRYGLAVQEDLQTRTSPDVLFRATVAWQP